MHEARTTLVQSNLPTGRQTFGIFSRGWRNLMTLSRERAEFSKPDTELPVVQKSRTVRIIPSDTAPNPVVVQESNTQLANHKFNEAYREGSADIQRLTPLGRTTRPDDTRPLSRTEWDTWLEIQGEVARAEIDAMHEQTDTEVAMMIAHDEFLNRIAAGIATRSCLAAEFADEAEMLGLEPCKAWEIATVRSIDLTDEPA